MEALKRGVDEWLGMVGGTELEATGEKVSALTGELLGFAVSMKDAVEERRRAEKATGTARKIFDESTMPILHKTVAGLSKLKEKALEDLSGMRGSARIYGSETLPDLEETRKHLNAIRARAREHIMTDEIMLNAAEGTRRSVTVVSISAIILGILRAFFIVRGIIGVLQGISSRMEGGAGQVASASDQISASSRILPEGAGEQAASMKEMVAALMALAGVGRSEKRAEFRTGTDMAFPGFSLVPEKKRIAAFGTREVSPRQIIPLEGDDFEEF